MNAQVTIARNTGILMGMELGLKVLGIFVSVILARYLAPQGYGLLAFALAFVSLFDMLPGFGMGSLTTRDVAREPHRLNQYLCNGLIAKLGLSWITIAIIWASLGVVGTAKDRWTLVLLAGVVMALEATLRFVLAFFRAAQRMTTVALVNFTSHGGYIIAALAVVWFKGGLADILWSRIGVLAALVVGVVWLIHTRLGRLSWTFDPAFIWRMLKAASPFALSTFFVAVYVDIDVVMLSMMKGDVMTGWYEVARKFLKSFSFIPVSLREATLPAVAKWSQGTLAQVQGTLLRSCKALWMIALPIAAGGFVLAEPIVLVLYGPAYAPAIPALRVIMWSVLFTFLNGTLWATLVGLGRERRVTAYLGFSALLNLATNLIAIPRWGHVGAAATTVLSYAVVCLLQVRLLKRTLPSFSLWRQLGKPAMAAAAMMAFAWISRAGELLYSLIGSAAVYLGCLIASRAIGPKEWIFLRGLVQRRTA